ncbi:MAG: zf-HC2 domain-containing protein [Elusimicrobia bacterium]|nr:zf-HC2 domain-containing protein [Elusimicrobiota bacterium]
MNCKEAKELLVPFLEGEFSGPQKEGLAAHIEACPSCREEKELLVRSWQMLDNYTPPKLKDGFTASLMRRARSEGAATEKTSRLPRLSFWLAPRRLLPAFASLLVIATAASLFWKKEAVPEKQPAPAAPAETVPAADSTAADSEIIENLDVYENAEMLKDLDFLSELDAVEKMNSQALSDR